MAQKPETKFIQRINRLLPLKMGLHYEKMNNPYRRGTADSWYSGDKADLWVEWKYLPTLPKVIYPQKLLHPLQRAWLNGRYKEGRNVVVIIGCPEGGVVLEDATWNNEIMKQDFLEQLKSATEIACFVRGICLQENDDESARESHCGWDSKHP